MGTWHVLDVAVENENIWFGVAWNGIVKYVKAEGRWEKLWTNEFPVSSKTIAVDGDYVWMGSDGEAGLFRYDKVNSN